MHAVAALPHVRLPESVDCDQSKGTLHRNSDMNVAKTDLSQHAAARASLYPGCVCCVDVHSCPATGLQMAQAGRLPQRGSQPLPILPDDASSEHSAEYCQPSGAGERCEGRQLDVLSASLSRSGAAHQHCNWQLPLTRASHHEQCSHIAVKHGDGAPSS